MGFELNSLFVAISQFSLCNVRVYAGRGYNASIVFPNTYVMEN